MSERDEKRGGSVWVIGCGLMLLLVPMVYHRFIRLQGNDVENVDLHSSKKLSGVAAVSARLAE